MLEEPLLRLLLLEPLLVLLLRLGRLLRLRLMLRLLLLTLELSITASLARIRADFAVTSRCSRTNIASTSSTTGRSAR